MRKLLILSMLVCIFIMPVQAAEFTAPQVPKAAERYFPDDSDSFSDGLWYIIKSAIADIRPDLKEAFGICFGVIAVVILISMLRGSSGGTKKTVDLVSVIAISALLIKPTNALIGLGLDTVTEITEYGKLLTPIMTGALAAQGGITSSAALYTGTTVFNLILSTCISKVITPLLYVFIALCIANNAVGDQLLKNLQNFIKWLMTWCLKTVIYVFTGYMSITGVVSGCTDASAIKAAKLTISGVVPVVGNIISDASDAVLSSAIAVKNAAGVYGLLAVAAIWIAPFLRVGIHYLLLKFTAGICGVLEQGTGISLLKDFCAVMGFVLALIGVTSLLVLISTVCFMKGVS